MKGLLAATQRGSPIYTWQNTGLDWSTTTSLTLRLRAPTPQPLYVGGTRSELTRLNHERVFATESLPANTDYRISVTGAAIRYRVVVTNAGGDELVDKVIHGTGDLPTTKTFTTGASGGVHQIRISNGDTGSLSNQYVSGWMAVIFLPMGVDETLNQRVSVGSRYSATFTVYGDTDQFTAEFAAGNRYVIEVHGRDEDRRLQPERTAWTPRFPDITKPMTRDGSTFDVQHNPEKWWVDGVSKKVEFSRTTPGPVGPVTHRYKEYQAVVVDLTDEDDQQHAGTWRLRVQPTQRRPDGIRTYRVGTYQVEVRELPASAGATEALTASFEDLPEAHDGESPFTVRLAFNFAVTVSAEAMRDDALTVTGGAVTGARLADGHDDRWEIEVTPASHGEVTITAPGGRACDEPGALCTASGQTLGADASATVAGPPVEQLTATFEGVPDTHDGETAFGFRIAFSEDVATSAEAMRDHALTVTGGTVTDAARVDARDDLWSVTVSPSGADDIEIELPPGRACTETGAICTPEGRELSTGLIQFVLADVENGGGPALTAAFEDVPAEHDGESAFRFRAAFSEDIGISYRALREDAFTVAGGHVTRGRRVDDRRDLFEITVQPDSDEAVTITLPGGRDCATSGAICTKGENRRQLTNSPSATVAGPTEQRSTNSPATGAPAISGTPQVGETLSASTSGISDADGLENADFAYQWIRGNSDIGGGTGSTYTAVDTDEGERLRVRVSFTDDAGNEESLTSAATEAVAAAPEPLTASFSSMPAEHRGEGNFKFRAAFSDEIKISYTTMRDTSFTVTNGDITKARRVDGRRDLWEMTVEPDSHAAVTIRLPETHDCDASGAVCTADGRPLSHSLSATVTGPVGISVADARVDENAGAVLAFAVTLTRAASGTVTVDYATENGSATAGNDYTAATAGDGPTRKRVGNCDGDHENRKDAKGRDLGREPPEQNEHRHGHGAEKTAAPRTGSAPGSGAESITQAYSLKTKSPARSRPGAETRAPRENGSNALSRGRSRSTATLRAASVRRRSPGASG